MSETITSHTKGPCIEEVDPDYPDQPSGWIVGVVEYAGCGSHEAKWTSEANKRLALSAPDLLEALTWVTRALEKAEAGYPYNLADQAIRRANMVISAATGEASDAN